jgi:acetate kinase
VSDTILILNAGSSSLKFSIFRLGRRLEPVVRGVLDSLDTAPRFVATDARGEAVAGRSWGARERLTHAAAARFLLDWARVGPLRASRLAAAGHRVVHAGDRFHAPARIDPGALDAIESLVPLAPLHQPHNLAAIRAVAELEPQLPQVACFDTAFHNTIPPAARTFAIPRRFTDAGVRRYGFHGISYEYIAHALPDIDPAAARGRTVVAHLGNGASMCALRDGTSIATTMGFTPLDGLVMGTRPGSIDPGVLLHLHRHERLSFDDIEHLLYHESGLLGASGISADMRTLLASTNPRAREAIDLFVHRAAREIASLAADLAGLDALVFTGGIGEHAAPVRAAICRASAWLGVELDDPANARHDPRISTPASRVAVLVIPTNEELMIARHTTRVLGLARST